MKTTTVLRDPKGPPSLKMARFLSDLLDKREGFTAEFEARVREAIAPVIDPSKPVTRPMTKEQAHDTIEWLLAKPKKAPKPKTTTRPPWPDEGLYRHDDGSVWRVYHTQNRRLAAKRLEIQETHDGWAGRFQFVRGGLYRLAEALAEGKVHLMTQAEATEFGRMYNFCVNCGAELTDDRSLAAGYGPTCAVHRGWHYPNKAEAAEILGRPVL